MTEENISIRLKHLIQLLGISSSQFADDCKIPRPTFSQIINGRSKKISSQLIQSIHEQFPSVSINWLLFNEGDPFINQISSDLPQNDTFIEETCKSSLSYNENSFSVNKNLNENSKELTVPSDNDKYSKEKPLKNLLDNPYTTENEESKNDKKTLELLSKIDNFRSKPRKVVSITIYYDDSTFETFRPE